MTEKLVLAPLAGYTDKAFREICSLYGAKETITEMISAEGLARDSQKTKALLERFDGEENLIPQLFGSNGDSFSRAISILMCFNPTSLDINAGCPVTKVVKTGAGSALMKEPKKIKDIVKVLKEGTGLSISVKFRLGWDKDSINYLEFAENAILGGASALTLHARTKSQGYEGKADKSAFKALKEHFKDENIRLYASGDIFSPEDAAFILNDLGLDGVMFARGAIGNPFIFKETEEYLKNGTYSTPSKKERIKVALLHYSLMEKYYGERLASVEMRKHVFSYIKGIKGAKECKEKLSKATTFEEYETNLKSLLEN